VAPPDRHLVLDDGHINLWRGPRENLHRPAINPLFRSAAVEYGKRVVGVILTGTLDDGIAGLWWVKRYGGVAVVQNPRDAEFSQLPAEALEHVKADYVVGLGEVSPLLISLADGTTNQPLSNLAGMGEPNLAGLEEEQ
jgi:two-component system chemotaxis response regulator CheB